MPLWGGFNPAALNRNFVAPSSINAVTAERVWGWGAFQTRLPFAQEGKEGQALPYWRVGRTIWIWWSIWLLWHRGTRGGRGGDQCLLKDLAPSQGAKKYRQKKGAGGNRDIHTTSFSDTAVLSTLVTSSWEINIHNSPLLHLVYLWLKCTL